jgi:putative copper export protein
VAGLTLIWETAPKALLYAALLPALGACAARWVLLPRLGGALPAAVLTRVERSLGRIGLLSALVVLTATLARAWTHTVTAFGFADARSWEAVRVIAFESRWGSGWTLQAAAAALLATVLPRIGWPLTAASGAAFCVALPLLGHAAGSAGRMAIHTAHLVGAGLWLGTLVAVWVVARLESRRGVDRDNATAVAPLLLERFSTLALSGATLLLLAGVAAATLYVGSPSSLWTTGYGRMLSAKVVLAAAIAACGFVNWRRFDDPVRESKTLPSTVSLEVTLAVAVVLATSVLTELEH